MKAFELKPPKNANYCATVVALSQFVELANCDNVKAALIFGNSVIVSKAAEAGEVGLFFPAETQLHKIFVGSNNLFRKAEWGNADPEKKGFFEQHGRVKAVKFRGHKSEGFWLPIECLDYITNGEWYPEVGASFDTLGEFEICRKYIPKMNTPGLRSSRARQPRLEEQIVEGQFRFHYDTEQLRRNVHKIQPTDMVSISDKWHGTSAVVGKVLVKRPLAWYERLLQKLGVKLQETEYGLTYSSRRVVKGVGGEAKANAVHFYTEDIWGVVAKEVEERIPEGFTVYGEIVGFTGDGGQIQKGYHYGCPVGAHQFIVYRVTVTTPTGQVVELTWPQMYEFCSKYGFAMVKTFYYGKAKDLFPHLDTFDVSWWQQNFLQELEKTYVQDGDCPYNNPGTPAEGIVVRIDKLQESEAFKLKNFRFLEFETKMLDQGIVDMETAEAETPEDGFGDAVLEPA